MTLLNRVLLDTMDERTLDRVGWNGEGNQPSCGICSILERERRPSAFKGSSSLAYYHLNGTLYPVDWYPNVAVALHEVYIPRIPRADVGFAAN